MKVIDIKNKLEDVYPLSLADSWDNCGLLIGNSEQEVKKILITLDVNFNSVKQAIENNVDMIISHHPAIFQKINSITNETNEGKLILSIIQNNISVYCAHTNVDVAEQGINSVLAQMFSLANIEILEKNEFNTFAGLGRIGTLKHSMTLTELASLTKNILKTPCVRVCGDLDNKISKIAIASGSCSEVIPLAIEKKCDAVITGDMKYHESLDLVRDGICIIDAGHFPTEQLVTKLFENALKEYKNDIEIIIAKEKDIFQFI